MTNQIKTFENNEFGEIEVMVIDGKEYFPATQCAKFWDIRILKEP